MTFQIFCRSLKLAPGIDHEGDKPSARDKSARREGKAHYAVAPFFQFPLSS